LILDALATGGIGTAIGTALGAGDTFLLDKLLNKWKPNFQLNQGYNAIKRFTK
jgi:ABC-type branched-subunit amino acid transport system permease subunit